MRHSLHKLIMPIAGILLFILAFTTTVHAQDTTAVQTQDTAVILLPESAKVTSDKPDYAPRSTAVFTGSGFAPYEPVVLKVKNLNRPCNTVSADSSYLPWTVEAGPDGSFVTAWIVCDCLGDSLRLKATGQSSGLIAYAYFTDGDGDGTMTVTPSSVCSGSTGNNFAFQYRVGSAASAMDAGSQATIVIPAGWTIPQTSNSSDPGFISVAPVGTGSTASITSISGSGSGPRTILITFFANTGSNGFNLSYTGVTASSTSGNYTFTTRTNDAGILTPGGLQDIDIQPSVLVGAPAQPGNINGSATYCSTNANYSISTVPGATGYQWTVPAGWSITSGQGTISINVSRGSSGGTISVKAVNSCGASSSRDLQVTQLNDIGFNNNISVNSLTICAGANPVTINGGDPGSGPNYLWQVDDNPGFSSPATVAGTSNQQNYTVNSSYYNTPGIYYFRRQSTSSGCDGFSDVVTLIVNGPTGAINGTASICKGNSTNLSITVTGTGPWNGTLSNGQAFSGSSSPILVPVSPAATTTYTIATLSDANCTAVAGGKTGSAVITVNQPPTVPGTAICQGATAQPLKITSACAVQTVVYNPGTSQFIVPAGVTEITVQARGGGGAGGGAVPGGGTSGRGGGGGGGGAHVQSTISVTPGQILDVYVAKQVPGVTGGNGANGEESYVKNGLTFLVKAAGGRGGEAMLASGSGANGGAADGGAGGSIENSIGDAGESGEAGTASTGTGGGAYSGAGGDGANGGGAGGDRITSGTSAGEAGSPFGGGGSGARVSCVTIIVPICGESQPGGAGASGQVVITYNNPTAISWYDAPSGGNLLYNGANFDPTAYLPGGNTNKPGTYTFYAECSGSPGCRTATEFEIKATPVVTFESSPESSVCPNTDVTYTTQPGQTNYVWSVQGVLNTDYTITSGGTANNNTVTLQWLTGGDKTVTVNYTNSNGCSGASAASSTITVHEPLSIETQPKSQIITFGASTDFSVEAKGTPELTYQWEVNIGDESGFFTIEDATSATLYAEQPEVPVKGYYLLRVKVTNSCASVTSDEAELVVNPKAATIVANNNSKTYGDENPDLEAVVTGTIPGYELNYTIETTADKFSGVGSYPITVTLGENPNYTVTTTDGTLTVNKATLTITAADKSRAYGDPNPVFTGSYSGEKNGETFTLDYSTDATATSAVGDYAIVPSVSGATLSNYTVVPGKGILTVNKATLTISADDKSRAYGDANPVFTGSYSGEKNGETFTLDYSTDATATSAVGDYAIVASVSGATLSNYKVVPNNGILTVNKATLTISADDKSRAYGDPNPVFTVSYNGFKNGEMLATSGVTGAPSLATTATAASPVGDYAIQAATGTLSAPNYQFSLVNGTLHIGKRAITITADDKFKCFDAPDPAFTARITSGDVVAGDLPTGVLTRESGTTGGTYAINKGSYTYGSNYAETYVGAKLTINSEISAAITTNNSTLYYGYTGDQSSTITVKPSGGTAPYTVTIKMIDPNPVLLGQPARPIERSGGRLICNSTNASGDEVWTPGANTNTALNRGNTCATNADSASSTSAKGSITKGGSYSVNVTLLTDARFIAEVTDAMGCRYEIPLSQALVINAEDVRCFAGNSGNAKVKLCHKTGSTKNPCVTICVDASAVEEHLAHGDTYGACPTNGTCPAPSGVTSSGSSTSALAAVLSDKLEVKVMPNPSVRGVPFILTAKGKSNEEIEIRVVNIVGQEVYKVKGSINDTYRFGSEFRSGVYIVQVMQGKSVQTLKLIKQ